VPAEVRGQRDTVAVQEETLENHKCEYLGPVARTWAAIECEAIKNV
jgi:hypothetical protein